jgi:hypothetical protein
MRRAVLDRTLLRGGASLLLAVWLAASLGCGKTPPRAGGAGVAASSGGVGVATPSGAMPPPPAADVPVADSTSNLRFASLEAARDSVYRLLRGVVDLADTAVHLSRDTVTFEYWHAKATARGWVVKVVVNDTIECPIEKFESALMARGWVQNFHYQADSDDGEVLGLAARDLFCVVEGRWDGGDPTDSTYVPRPGCTVTATIVPLRADDAPK